MCNSKIIKPKGILKAVVIPPGSKSITNRALILAALADGKTVLTGVLDCEDTRVMFNALTKLGFMLHWDTELHQIEVYGQGGTFPHCQADIYIGNSGTSARFLTAALAFGNYSSGNYRIHGKPRMHLRPIGDLVNAINSLGGNVTYEADEYFPPLRILGPSSNSTRENTLEVSVPGSVSSQYLSALLLAAPLASRQSAIRISIAGPLVSKPYIDMTVRMMKSFGVIADSENGVFFIPQAATYQTPGTYQIEPDASAASYFLAAAAVCGGSVTAAGLSANSLQGDTAFAECLQQMNCEVEWHTDFITVCRPPDKLLRGISVDMNSISDTAQTLAVVALFAEGTTEISNIEHVRFKETDRIADLATELRRFGAEVEERPDGLRIVPPPKLIPAAVKTYDDHRMAMSFAVAGLKLPGISICNPECTQKTFPGFFNELEKLQEESIAPPCPNSI